MADKKQDKSFFSGTKMNRRRFLKTTGVVGAATVGVGGGYQVIKSVVDDKPRVMAPKVMAYETFRSSCAMECLHCNLTAYVYDGKIMKVEASDGFNVKACLRGISRTQWVNHEERLKMPLLRTGKKGSGEFKEISWNEALDLIVEKITETKNKLSNPTSIAYTCSRLSNISC